MKSPMVQTLGCITDKEKYSDLQVLKSGAGFYVGTLYRNDTDIPGMVYLEPGSRDTEYFYSEKEASDYLKRLEAGELLPLRMHP